MSHIKTLCFFVLLVVPGCAPPQAPDTSSWAPAAANPSNGKYWEPSPDQKAKAELLGRWFASNDLGLTHSEVRKVRADFMGTFEDENPIIWIQFYDPAHYKPLPDGHLEAVFGGFPTYFTVSVDAQKWRVVDHYAADE